MNRDFHRWHSPRLNRPMELLMYGRGGAHLLVFPTSQGRFYEWEDRGMVGSLREMVDRGWLMITCVDSVDAESWYNWGAHPGHRAYRHLQYLAYLHDEVLPLMRQRNSNPFVITTGASFGAFHAASLALRYPHEIQRVLGMSGLYDIRGFTGGYSDENVYLGNPAEFVAGEHDPHRLDAMRRMDIILVAGTDDRLLPSSQAMSRVLWSRGIGNALREWHGWYHDWPYWERMLHMYVGGHD